MEDHPSRQTYSSARHGEHFPHTAARAENCPAATVSRIWRIWHHLRLLEKFNAIDGGPSRQREYPSTRHGAHRPPTAARTDNCPAASLPLSCHATIPGHSKRLPQSMENH